MTVLACAHRYVQEAKKLANGSGSGEDCGVLGVRDAMVLLEHCLEASGSSKGVRGP